jgi:hypothetical protein
MFYDQEYFDMATTEKWIGIRSIIQEAFDQKRIPNNKVSVSNVSHIFNSKMEFLNIEKKLMSDFLKMFRVFS